MYDEVLSFCKEHGQFDPALMGNVSNVGLMAQKAEEYGSHDKTFVRRRQGRREGRREGRQRGEGGSHDETFVRREEGEGGREGRHSGREEGRKNWHCEAHARAAAQPASPPLPHPRAASPAPQVIPRDGTVRVVLGSGETVFSHAVQQGDIWRMCSTKHEPIRDWVRRTPPVALALARTQGPPPARASLTPRVYRPPSPYTPPLLQVRLAVERARKTMDPVIFWLDPKRAHDGQLIAKVGACLQEHDLSGLDISIKEPVVAMRHTLGRARVGLDTVSVTGNVSARAGRNRAHARAALVMAP